MKSVKSSQEKSCEQELVEFLLGRFNVTIKDATDEQLFIALADIVTEKLYDIRETTNAKASVRNAKAVHYVSIEFLLGKSLKSHLWNLGLEKDFAQILKKSGKSIEDIYSKETEANLGNGGLGRLAACYLDSLTSEGYNACGHCINYDYGLFKQKIVDCEQVELSDEWTTKGDVWLQPRGDESCVVRFGGRVEETLNVDGSFAYIYHNAQEVQAYPYDMLVSGVGGKKVNVLKLWSAKSLESYDTKKFSQGEYAEAMANKDDIEAISKVLYPTDSHEKGKSLRLKQEYFLASAVAQNIIKTNLRQGRSLYEIPEFVAVHINDTHPSLIVPEFMRILMDEHGLGWEEAWSIVCRLISYTNHTLLSESLEKKELNLVERYIPRIAMIVKEINRRFVKDCQDRQIDSSRINNMAIIQNGVINMTNLVVVASTFVNGVSAIHSELVKNDLLKSYASIYPEKFLNVTNGVTHRRWLSMCNPEMDKLITSLFGSDYHTDAKKLAQLDEYANKEEIIAEFERIKTQNKLNFAKYLQKAQGIIINPNSRFDVHVKRIHEYKRQLLNVLKIIYLYSELKANPSARVTPQTFIFAGKAASSYYMAKRIIRLICKLGKDIDKNKKISKKLKVVFVENYSVAVSELLMPATDVTEQISLAGREASGTGNMKAVMNGALMIHTQDGANIEIAEHCGEKNSFAFGLTPEEVEKVWANGYDARYYYNSNPMIQKVIEMLKEGFDGESFADIASYLLGETSYRDVYMCLADFESYLDAHKRMDKVYKNKKNWYSKAIHNVASMGFFSSDRAINEYANKIWRIKKVN